MTLFDLLKFTDKTERIICYDVQGDIYHIQSCINGKWNHREENCGNIFYYLPKNCLKKIHVALIGGDCEIKNDGNYQEYILTVRLIEDYVTLDYILTKYYYDSVKNEED